MLMRFMYRGGIRLRVPCGGWQFSFFSSKYSDAMKSEPDNENNLQGSLGKVNRDGSGALTLLSRERIVVYGDEPD